MSRRPERELGAIWVQVAISVSEATLLQQIADRASFLRCVTSYIVLVCSVIDVDRVFSNVEIPAHNDRLPSFHLKVL